MTLVNIVPHVILHQKTHVPWAVNFFESQKASKHPVRKYQIFNLGSVHCFCSQSFAPDLHTAKV